MNQPDNSPGDKPNRKKFDPIGLETIELTVSHLFTTKKPSPPTKEPEPEPKKSTWLEYLKLKIDNFAKKFTNLWKMEPTVTENRVKRDFKMFIAPKNRPENPMNNSLQKDNLNQSIILKRRGERRSAKKPSFLNVMNYYRVNVFQNMKGKVNLDQPIKVWSDICEIKAEPQYPGQQEHNNSADEFEEKIDPKATPTFVELNNGKRAMIVDNPEQEKKFKMLQSSKKLFNKMRRSNKKFGKTQSRKKSTVVVNKTKPNTNAIETFAKNYFKQIDLSDDEEIMEEPKKKLFNNEKRDIAKPKEAPKLVLPPLSTHYKVNPFVKKILLNKETKNSPRNFFESMDSMEIEKPALPFIDEESIKPTYNFTIPEDQLFKNQTSIFPLSSSNGTSKDQSQIFSFANLSSSSSFQEKEKEEENQVQSQGFNGFYQFGRSTDSDQVFSKESLSIDSQSSDSLFKPRKFAAKKCEIEESFLKTEPQLLESGIKVVEVTERKPLEKAFAPVDDNIKVRKISSRLRIDEDEESEKPPKIEKKFQYTPAFGNKMIQPFIFEGGKYREK